MKSMLLRCLFSLMHFAGELSHGLTTALFSFVLFVLRCVMKPNRG